MRQQLIVVVTGLLAGIAGALLVGQFAPRTPAPAIDAKPAAELRPVIVPPGWDHKLDARLSSLETNVADQGSALAVLERQREAVKTSDEVISATADGVVRSGQELQAARELERQAQYTRELAQRAEMIAAHEREALNAEWADQQSALLERQFEALDPETTPLGIEAIDCRSETCIARLTFASPMEGLAFLQGGAIPVTEKCNGYFSTPIPPEGDGEYELSVLYTCR